MYLQGDRNTASQQYVITGGRGSVFTGRQEYRMPGSWYHRRGVFQGVSDGLHREHIVIGGARENDDQFSAGIAFGAEGAESAMDRRRSAEQFDVLCGD